MASYEEIFQGKLDFPKPFQRTNKFPLDRTDMFGSYEDAVLYAAGDRDNPDSRGLCGTSYIGQIITVYENDVVSVYVINAERKLEPIAAKSESISSIESKLEAGETSVTITIPENAKVLSIDIFDSASGEMVFTDISKSSTAITITVAEAHINALDILVSYRIS